MKNWKTTLVGFLGGLVLLMKNLIAVLDADTATNLSYEEVVIALGMMGIGWFSKDKNVTGGTVNQ